MGFIGIDGCRKGWLVVCLSQKNAPLTGQVFQDFSAIFEAYPDYTACAVDMPIGLPIEKERGGREADRLGRKLLGRRCNTLFSPPLRAWIEHHNYEEVRSLGVSRQSFLLWPKIREVDAFLNAERQERIFEAHPELAFAALLGEPLMSHKRSSTGQAKRLQLLEEKTEGIFTGIQDFCEDFVNKTPKKLFAFDDLLDACALVWVAWKHAQKKATCIPSSPPRDERDLRMEIWY